MVPSVTYTANHMSFNIDAYYERIGIDPTVDRPADLQTLTLIMAAHSCSIPFENIDCVLQKKISMSNIAVEQKLVASNRGGYCFEQNTLLQLALETLGYKVRPLLCRVRWGKTEAQMSTFTHVALAVSFDEHTEYLADVGFAGTNSIAPISLSNAHEPQMLPEGKFRIVPTSSHGGGAYTALQMYNRKEWKSLYIFRNEETAVRPDLECGNWLSCTHPGARFTNQFFCAIVVNSVKRHHILNDDYVIRTLYPEDEDKPSTAVTTKIKDVHHLVRILREVFHLDFCEGEEEKNESESGSRKTCSTSFELLGKYLTPSLPSKKE